MDSRVTVTKVVRSVFNQVRMRVSRHLNHLLHVTRWKRKIFLIFHKV